MLGKLQIAILRALRDREDRAIGGLHPLEQALMPNKWGLSFQQLCTLTRPAGVNAKTHATAVSRAVWSLAGQVRDLDHLVDVYALLWARVHYKDVPTELDADKKEHREIMYGMRLTWYGGHQPRIRKVEITLEGEYALEEWEEKWEEKAKSKAKAKPKTSTSRHCVVCGNEFTPARAHARTCSTRCRVAAHRAKGRQ